MTHTEIQANVTKTASFTGAGVDVSALGLDWTLKIQVGTLTAGAVARFEFDDTVTGFTTTFAGPTVEILGEVASTYDKVRSFKRNQFPGLSVGVANSLLRLKLTQLTAASSVTYHAWMET